MRHEHRQRLWFSLLGLTLVCLATTASHRWMNDLMPMWMACCQNLVMSLPNGWVVWLSLVPRTFLVVTLVWGVGILVQRLWQMHRFTAVVQPAMISQLPIRLTRLENEARLSSPLLLLPGPVPLAFCFGLLRPRICLSTGLVDSLTDKELKAVLCHEDHHCRRLDPLRKLLVDVLAATFFFLPVVAEWRDFCLTSAELAADRHAMHQAGRFPVAGALHKLLTHPLAARTPLNVPGISGLNASQARLAHLLDSTPHLWNFSIRNLLSSSLVLMLLCFVL